MAGLQDTKRRITSISTTKKITKAMELVASAKFGRLKKEHDSITTYCNSVKKLFVDLVGQSEDLSFLKKEEGKTLWIVVNSTLGLCGGYNSQINKIVEEQIKSDDLVIAVGEKAIQTYKKYNIVGSYKSLSKPVNYTEVKIILEETLKQHKIVENNVKTIKIAYSKFINAATFEPVIDDLFTFDVTEEKKSNTEEPKAEFIYEPNVEVALEHTIPLYVGACIYGALSHSFTSEEGSRRTAMESATDNAEEIKEKLELEYNRKRQAAITQEIAEIVGGANAL